MFDNFFYQILNSLIKGGSRGRAMGGQVSKKALGTKVKIVFWGRLNFAKMCYILTTFCDKKMVRNDFSH